MNRRYEIKKVLFIRKKGNGRGLFYNICFSLDIKCVEIDGLVGGRKKLVYGKYEVE